MSENDGETAEVKHESLELRGTSRLNASGSSGSGTLTLPKPVTSYYLEEYGKDFAVFSDDEKIVLVPGSEVTP